MRSSLHSGRHGTRVPARARERSEPRDLGRRLRRRGGEACEPTRRNGGRLPNVQRLSGLDAAFLAIETPSAHMHVMSTAILDPSTAPAPFGVERVRELLRERMNLLPPFRRRLVTVPFDLHNPLWVEDPNFDLDYHVRHTALPSPGGPRELAALTAEIAGRPLDRSRPLWELWFVEGL